MTAETARARPTREIEIVANGEARTTSPGTTVAGFLVAHELDPDLVVVERNSEILRRAAYDTTVLADGDALEIVHFVGGG